MLYVPTHGNLRTKNIDSYLCKKSGQSLAEVSLFFHIVIGVVSQVPGYKGTLLCPDYNIVCGASVTVHSITTKVHSTTTSASRGTKATAQRKTTTHAPEFNGKQFYWF